MNPTRTLSYPGDRTAAYDPSTGVGTVGKIMGVGALWFRVVDATYDPTTDRTRVTMERLIDPQTALARMQENR